MGRFDIVMNIVMNIFMGICVVVVVVMFVDSVFFTPLLIWEGGYYNFKLIATFGFCMFVVTLYNFISIIRLKTGVEK